MAELYTIGNAGSVRRFFLKRNRIAVRFFCRLQFYHNKNVFWPFFKMKVVHNFMSDSLLDSLWGSERVWSTSVSECCLLTEPTPQESLSRYITVEDYT